MLRITHIGGVPVVDQEIAMGPHPRWPDQQVAYSGITYVLLENGTSGFACDTCGYLRDKIRAVASHLIAHNGKDSESTLPLETLKALIRSVKRQRAAGYRDFNARTAEDLNRRGVKSHDGEPWNALRVGRLYTKWSPKIKVAMPPTPAPAQRQPSPISAVPAPSIQTEESATVSVSDVSLVRRLTKFSEKLEDLSNEFEQLASDVAVELGKPAVDTREIEELRADAARFHAIDQSVFDKAAKFDAAQSLFTK